MKNWDTVNKINVLNQMNSDFQYTGTGIEKTSPNVVITTPNNPLPTPVIPAKKKKQNGGRFRS